MHVSPVITPDGRPVFTVGGRHAWKTHSYRGWNVSLEWVISNTRRRAAPCMVIWPASNILMSSTSRECGVWAIGRRAISEFVGFDTQGKCTGSVSEHCLREAAESLPVLGKDRNDKQAFLSLVDTVARFAPDLVLMPPTPPQLQREDGAPAMWEVTATNKNTGKTIAESEV